jgi:transcriptional regulator with XRE-family HTH domain
MTLFERVKFLANKQGKSINDVENELNYSQNTLYRLKTTNPSAKKLEELADYFNVSADYLLGRTDDPYISKTTGMAAHFRDGVDGLTPDQIKELDKLTDAIIAGYKAKNEEKKD